MVLSFSGGQHGDAPCQHQYGGCGHCCIGQCGGSASLRISFGSGGRAVWFKAWNMNDTITLGVLGR
jgi:hypothetical protein